MAPVSSGKRRIVRDAPGLFETLKDDVCRVGADLKKRGWRREIGASFSGLEAFYLTDANQARLQEMTFISRWLHRFWWLVKSLLMKLTPLRRVLLAIALVNILGLAGSSYYLGVSRSNQVSDDQRVQVARRSFKFVGVGEVMLIVLLMLELKDKLIARQELEAGRVVQLALMPERAPSVPGWDLWLYSEPANDVGGDLVDHMRIDEHRHGVALGDVAGKALPAALLMVKLQATLRALAPLFDTLGDLGRAVNRIVQRDGLPNRFATLVYLVLTECSGEVRVLNGGHMPPFVVRAGALDRLPPGSMALGIMADVTFIEQRVELSEGDALIVFSDGVSEAMNSSGDFFGDERIGAVIHGAAGEPAAEIGDRLLQALAAFVGDARPHDDVSLMVLRRVNHA
jgi:serine phosphatase RsbU (regulator of sigma subunit)